MNFYNFQCKNLTIVVFKSVTYNFLLIYVGLLCRFLARSARRDLTCIMLFIWWTTFCLSWRVDGDSCSHLGIPVNLGWYFSSRSWIKALHWSSSGITIITVSEVLLLVRGRFHPIFMVMILTALYLWTDFFVVKFCL